MSIIQLGVSHHEVELSELEALSRHAQSLPRLLLGAGAPHVNGAVVLSTCNRVELYAEGSNERELHHAARDFLTAHLADALPRTGLPEPRFNADAARHLFAVSVGLESMVVGETEIAGQVRRAAADARDNGTVSPSLERLFRAATAAARRVSSSTGLGSAGRSLVSVALDLIEETEGPLAGRSALVIGTGSYARVVHAALQRRGLQERFVFSLSGRAGAFAEVHGGLRVSQRELMESLSKVDVVITSSGAPHPILEADMLATAVEGRASRMPVVDLALTRDVEAEAADIPGVRLIDLELIAQHAPRAHGEAISDAHRVVAEAAEDFAALEAERTGDDVIVAMRAMVHAVVEAEVERTRRRSGDDASEIVRRALHRVEQEILHVPTIRSRQLTREGRLDEVEHAVNVLLGISVVDDSDDVR